MTSRFLDRTSMSMSTRDRQHTLRFPAESDEYAAPATSWCKQRSRCADGSKPLPHSAAACR
jgi:hypothetical protein